MHETPGEVARVLKRLYRDPWVVAEDLAHRNGPMDALYAEVAFILRRGRDLLDYLGSLSPEDRAFATLVLTGLRSGKTLPVPAVAHDARIQRTLEEIVGVKK